MSIVKNSFSELGTLEAFDPKAFYPDDKVSQNICGFVLSLALIYTDIKNISIFYETLVDSKPDGSFKIREDWGEYNGLMNYIDRQNIGVLHELFKLIDKSKKILEDLFFKSVIRSINKEAKKSWQDLVSASLNRSRNNKLAKDLMNIRNKISFHYDQKIILRGYNHCFQNIKKVDKAYISRGNKIVESRFYFADAAAESYICSLSNENDIEEIFHPIREIVNKLNLSIWDIVINFIFKRGYGFSEVR